MHFFPAKVNKRNDIKPKNKQLKILLAYVLHISRAVRIILQLPTSLYILFCAYESICGDASVAWSETLLESREAREDEKRDRDLRAVG